MNILVETNTNIVRYIDYDFVIFNNSTVVSKGGELKFIVHDMNASNSTLLNVQSAPEDWVGGKYLLYDGEWVLNPDWEDYTIV
jgi:hypothetical protein